MKSLKKQKGFWNFVLPAAAAVGGALIGQEGQEDTNEANAGINSAQQAYNAREAHNNRVFQEAQRTTQYQTAMYDMEQAGLNPMLAYQNGGAKPTSGAQAQSGPMIPMQNTAAAGINGAIAAAQIANVQSQTEVNKAQAEKTKAEVPQVETNTKVLAAQLPKITAEIDKLVEERTVLIKEGWNKTDVGNLLRAQEALTKIESRLKANTINVQDAEIALKRAETVLRELAMPGAKNEAEFETKMGEGVGTGTKSLNGVLQLLKGLTGK